MSLIYDSGCLMVILYYTKLRCFLMCENMFSDMVHQEYTLSYMQNIYSSRDEQRIYTSTPVWSRKILLHTRIDITSHIVPFSDRRSEYQ